MTNSTSYGQTLLRDILTRSISGTFVENHRPEWLRGLELDFYYEQHGLAFEFQGDQHFVPVFGAVALQRQQANDTLKRRLCRERGVILVKVEAVELRKLKLRAKILAALNHYRPFAEKKNRNLWLKTLGLSKYRGVGRSPEAVAYCETLQRNYGGVTSIPKRYIRLREKATQRKFG